MLSNTVTITTFGCPAGAFVMGVSNFEFPDSAGTDDVNHEMIKYSSPIIDAPTRTVRSLIRRLIVFSIEERLWRGVKFVGWEALRFPYAKCILGEAS